MARHTAAWGVEVGAKAVKGIRLQRDGHAVTVTDFAVVPHKKVLSTPDIDQNVMIRLSLGQFISENGLEGEHLVMSVPGHAAFARFAKLPPVDPKKVPDIVKFEAVQQIPFPIDQVEWDYQTFSSEESPEVEVGIFAITRERVQQRLALYRELGIAPDALTLSPVAVYNAMSYDHQLDTRKGAVIYLDIGTNATDVIIAEEGRCWIRTFPLGGTHFTEAIASTFKLSYAKAEKLKHDAAASKYAKQIMQAMRPVFSDLLQDLQRSIGYYQTLHRDATLSTMVGLGSTFRIPGLRKFLGQQLQMQVLRLDEYKKITVTGRDAATFAQNAVGMATAYGLALQGVGLGVINANLVPVESVRTQLWREKTKWFGAAAAIAVMGAAMTLYRPISDRGAMSPEEPVVVTQVLASGERLKKDYDQVSNSAKVGFAAENFRRLTDHRHIWPNLVNDTANALSSTDPQPELLGSDVEKILAIPPQERRLVELEHLSGDYRYETDRRMRVIDVTIEVRVSHDRPIEFLNGSVAQWLRDNAEREGVPYRVIDDTISCNPAQMEEFMATEGGEESIGRSRSAPKGGSGLPIGGRQPPGSKKAPPGKGGGSTGSSGAGGMSGGTLGRRAPRKKRDAPGKNLGGGGMGSGGGSNAGRSSSSRSRSGGLSGAGGGGQGGSGEHLDLDAMSPVPDRPSLYPPGSKYYRVPITFTVELDPDPKRDSKSAKGGDA